MDSMEEKELLQNITQQEYKEGFVTDVEQVYIPKGLNEDIIRMISSLKEEPEWLLEFRLDAFRKWQAMEQPRWGHLDLPEIDYQDIIYYAAPKKDSERPKEIDPALAETFEKLGIPLHEREALAGVVAVDAVFDSVSVKTTFRKALSEKGIIFCSFSEAVREHPDLVRKYLATVVPAGDNYFAALNSAVFSDGSFCYIPKGVKCPMELSSYFRINAAGTGQFERTLIVADEGSQLSYMEGCTAPMRDENQLHAAVVEIIVEKDADVKYSTVQNWYPGDAQGRGGILNLVTKRGLCRGAGSHGRHGKKRAARHGRVERVPRSCRLVEFSPARDSHRKKEASAQRPPRAYAREEEHAGGIRPAGEVHESFRQVGNERVAAEDPVYEKLLRRGKKKRAQRNAARAAQTQGPHECEQQRCPHHERPELKQANDHPVTWPRSGRTSRASWPRRSGSPQSPASCAG